MDELSPGSERVGLTKLGRSRVWEQRPLGPQACMGYAAVTVGGGFRSCDVVALSLRGVPCALVRQEWRKKAREVEKRAHSRRGIIRAQALVRGHLDRSRHRMTARFLPDNTDA